MAATHQLKVQDIFSVKDFVCVVTGGGTGIGLMCSQALAANGAKVYITGRRIEVLENAAKQHTPQDGGEIIPIGPCDVTSKQEIGNLVQQITKKEKYINLLITNAGVSGPKGIPESSDASELHSQLWNAESVEDWGSVMTTNVMAESLTKWLEVEQGTYERNDHF